MSGSAPERAATAPGVAEGTGSTPRVLVLDGDRVSRRFAEMALSAAGFSVETAGSGAAALELLASSPVNLVVCDTELPDVNGLALFRRLRQERRLAEVPVVFLTARTRPTDLAEYRRAGAARVIPKPFELDVVRREIEGAWAEHHPHVAV